jgi:hypothetical protein
MNILKHTKLKNLKLTGLNENICIRRENENTKKKPHHIIFQVFANDDMYLHEILIEILNIAKNYLNSRE